MSGRQSPRTKLNRAIDGIYAEIPSIPDCTGDCASACGPIAMFAGEWDRVKRSAGRTPKRRPGSLVCPMLSPTGKCTVYSVRPYICRLWGTTRTLACPKGCQPERWLSTEEAHGIFARLLALAGPTVTGPLGDVNDLWEQIGLEPRERRLSLIHQIEEAVRGRSAS